MRVPYIRNRMEMGIMTVARHPRTKRRIMFTVMVDAALEVISVTQKTSFDQLTVAGMHQ